MDARESTIRVVMLPWLAHGHITPFLELALKLTKRNFYIYLCSTPVNLNSIKNKVTEKYSLSIQLVELHLPSTPNLPPQYHTTYGLPPNLAVILRKAFELSSPSIISNIIKSINPDLVIYDLNQPFTPEIASSLNIPAVQFVTSGAAMVSFVIHMFKRHTEKFPFPAIHLKKFDCLAPRNWDSSQNDGKDKDRVLGSLQRSSNIVLLSTFRDIEGKYLDYLSSLLEKKMVPTGSLIQQPIDKNEDTEIIRWLDKKQKCSTVFVSFGSECFLTKEETIEVAYGLEFSGVNFIWVLRFPVGEEVRVEEALPEGFLERVGERGTVFDGLAPQPKILGHPSTGGFVCHCGWNSILESMKSGVPIIAMPMHLDQPLNARLVVEIGMGVEVEKDNNGMFEREEIAKVIRKVVVEKNGDYIGLNTMEWSEKMRSIGEEEMDGVVEELIQLCREVKK